MTRRFAMVMVFALVMTISAVAEAQDLARFYIVPKVDVTIGGIPSKGPKYFPALGVSYSAMDYGREDTMLVGATVTAAQNTTLSANLDVTAIPSGLDSNVSSAALATVQTKLEGMKIPAGWVTTSTTYRQVVGTVGRLFLLMQRFDAINMKTFFESGITLDTRINQLTQAQRNALAGAAASMNLDTAFVTGSMTVRAVLKSWVDMMGPFSLAGETF